MKTSDFQIQNEFGNSRDTTPIIQGCSASRFDQTVTYFTIDISLRIYPYSKSKGVFCPKRSHSWDESEVPDSEPPIFSALFTQSRESNPDLWKSVQHASVRALEESADTKKYYNVLKLFAYGTVTDYRNDKEVIGWELNEAESQKLKVRTVLIIAKN